MNYAGAFDFGSLGVSAEAGGHTAVTSTATSHVGSSSAIIVEDAGLVFSGDYARRGGDLVLSKDGHDHVIQDYFKGHDRKALGTPDGATLSPEIVKALVGEVQVAQAGAANAAGQVIGTVSKLTGTATAIRNGVSVTLNVGDNVQKGDVVQAGADSSLNLAFIDGTVFGLSANARMVLNEMVYDPQGSANSSLLSLVQGTITFVAGETAKNGNMRVDTPVATMGIRGTAVLVEIGFEVPGQGNAPPVKFQVLVEPGGHVGSYLLYSKSDPSLVIGTVNQAGQVTSIAGNGDASTAQAGPLPPIAQAIIQQTLQQYFPNYIPDANPRGNAPGGGSAPSDPTPGASNPDPIKFTPPGDLPIGTPILVPINLPGSPIGTPPVNVIITRLNSAPTVTVEPVVVTLPRDASGFDIDHQVTIIDPDVADIAVRYVPGSARIVSAAGPAATPSALDLKSLVAIDPQTGEVSYDPAGFKFLAAGQKAVYTIAFDSRSGPDTTHQTLTLTVDGSNDAPVFMTALTGAVIQGDAVRSFDLLTGASDPDLGETATLTIGGIKFSLNGSPAQPAAPGGVTLDGSTLHVDPNAFAYLGAGETATVTVSYRIIDAHGASVPQSETITITGVNDAPRVVSTNFSVTPNGDVTLNASSFTISDADHSSNITFTVTGVTGGTFVVGSSHAMRLAASGPSSFTMEDLQQGRVHFISDGSGAPRFTLTVDDGSGAANSKSAPSEQTVAYVNAPPVVHGPLTLNAREGDDAVTVDLLAGASDPDPGHALSIDNVRFILNGEEQEGIPRGLSLCGSSLTLDPDSQAFNFLAAGQTMLLVVSYDILDGQGARAAQTETITIVGTNDRPTISAASFCLTEGGTTVLRACDIGLSDADSGDFTFTATSVRHGKFQVTANGTTWHDAASFTSAQLAAGFVRFVHDGSERDASFAISANDGSSENNISNVFRATIEIVHVNDAPKMIAAPLLIAEGGTVVLTVLNFLTIDPDDHRFTFHVSNVHHGEFQLWDGQCWVETCSFTTADLKAGHVIFSHDGGEAPPSYTVVADDGHDTNHVSNPVNAAVLFVPINDAPIITGAHFSVEQGHSVLLHAANFDVCDPDSSSFKFTVSHVEGGRFETWDADHCRWVADRTFTTAELNADHVRFVQDGSDCVPTFSIKANDGSWINGTGNQFTHAQVTVLHAPEIDTRHLDAQLDPCEGGVTITGVAFSDQDADCRPFHLTATACEGSVALEQSDGSQSELSASLAGGFTYRPAASEAPYVEKVSLTVTDPDGLKDQVSFVFQVGATDQCQVSPLVGGAGKDILVSSAWNETMTGGRGADQFVFGPNNGHDFVTDFRAGVDKIDLHVPAFAAGNACSFQEWMCAHAESKGCDTLLTLDDCGRDTVLLQNVTVSQLHQNDFIVHA